MKIIYDRFIAPLKEKKLGNVGTELEYPLINLSKKPVDTEFAAAYLKKLATQGFEIEDCDTYGNPAFVVNGDGDVISFDNSYNNIEFSMNYGGNLNDIRNRFYKLYNDAADYFSAKNYIIAGIGYNVYKDYTVPSHVSYPVYNMVYDFLSRYDGDGTHNMPYFPAYLSSVQTHLDADINSVPKIADLFAKIDFAAAYVFSNSPCGEYLCYRDYLWENSGFGKLADNTGECDTPYRDIKGVEANFLKRSMFNRIRDGKYEIFRPTTVEDYFSRDDALDEDIQQFLSFKNIEITARGTVEVRSTCTQPVADAFAPSAFYLGLANNLRNAEDAAYSLLLNEKNSVLRHMAVKGVLPDGVTKDEMILYITRLLNIAKEGLLKRNLGEEELLAPLYERVKTLTCPAVVFNEKLKNGICVEDVLKEFSKI